MFIGTNSRDPRLNFETLGYNEFQKMAFYGVRNFGAGEWSFSGNGIEYDPIIDLGLPPEMFEDNFVPKYRNDNGNAKTDSHYQTTEILKL